MNVSQFCRPEFELSPTYSFYEDHTYVDWRTKRDQAE